MAQLTHELVETTALPVWYTLASLTILLAQPRLPQLCFSAGARWRPARRSSGSSSSAGANCALRKEGLVHLVGFIVLIGFMFIIMFNDVRRIISGDSFFG
ncbi:MAG: hypothetical protein R2848_11110 [Thermomicrobiales bacterium]